MEQSYYEYLMSIKPDGADDEMVSGKNEDGETVCVSYYKDSVVVSTSQGNGWHRVNTYYQDGSVDEAYER